MSEEPNLDELIQLVGDQLLADGDPAPFRDMRFIEWLSEDLRSSMSSAEAAKLDAEAGRFAQRVSRRIAAQRMERRVRRADLNFVAANDDSDRRRPAPLFDMEVAAGLGRELWEDDCDSWIQVPEDLPDARYIALRVSGDSMLPLLEPREVILIQLGTTPVVDDLIVARRPDEGYVVKRVSRVRRRTIELEPLNPKYDSFTIPNDSQHVLGTVVARFYRP